MAKEIERKFLVVGDNWRKLAKGTHYRQGYLNSVKERTVRIRTIDDKAFLTVKGPNIGITRMEFEYEIPHKECLEMLTNLAEQPIIENSETTPQLTDFSDSKAEALGRSMLFKGVDDVNNDLKALMENPQIAENSDELFETAYKVAQQVGAENPYEEAASASTTAV